MNFAIWDDIIGPPFSPIRLPFSLFKWEKRDKGEHDSDIVFTPLHASFRYRNLILN